MVKTYDDQPLFQQAVEAILAKDNSYVRERVVYSLNVRLYFLALEHRLYQPHITPHDLAWAGYHDGVGMWLCSPTKSTEFLQKQIERRIKHRENLIKELTEGWFIDYMVSQSMARELVDKLILQDWRTQTLQVETE